MYKYEVHTQFKAGTLDRLVWMVKIDLKHRIVWVWRNDTWEEAPEGEELPYSFSVPYRLWEQVVEALS